MALYTKYRPQKFSDLMGQEHVAVTLSRAVQTEKTVHSYLFSGSRGVGKTTVARLLARAVNCENTKGEVPCGQCASCRLISAGRSVDVLEIDAASNRGIDEIRELRDKVRFAPTTGKYKVYIIDEVHMLTKEAFNALLKTLEEPPPHAIFILATTESHKVPITIVSRCQRYDFRRATVVSVLQLLEKVAKEEKISADKDALSLLARAADGAFRDALTLLEQLADEAGSKITLGDVRQKLGLIADPLMWQLLEQLARRDTQAALLTFNKFNDQGIDWRFMLAGLLVKLRQLLFYLISEKALEADLTPEEEKHLKKMATVCGESDVVAMINVLMRAERELRTTSLPDVAVAAALVEYLGATGTSANAGTEVDTKPTAPTPLTDTPSCLPLDKGDAVGVVKEGKGEVKALSGNPPLDKGRQGGVKPSPAPADTAHVSTASNQSEMPLDQETWRQVVAMVRKDNTTFSGLLSQSHPYVSGSSLVIEVPYPFWEEKVRAAKNIAQLTAALKTATNKDMKVTTRANGSLREKQRHQAAKEEQEVLNDVKSVFGG